jgi:hypothetical protein
MRLVILVGSATLTIVALWAFCALLFALAG